MAKATGFDLEVRSQGGGEGEHDQTGFIGDGFERHDLTGRAMGRGLDLGFTGDISLRPSAWAWRE